MAQITFNVADADVPRIVDAFEYQFGQRDPGAETITEFVKRHIILRVNLLVKDVLAIKARSTAVNSYVDLDIT